MTDKNIERFVLAKNTANVKASMNVTKNGQDITINKCNQCKYTSSDSESEAGNLRRHLKTHGGEKSNKCNQCDFASFYASALRTHLKTHSGEKSNKCNQCDFASRQAGHLRTHMKIHSGEKPNNETFDQSDEKT